jgi:hypothetical protein
MANAAFGWAPAPAVFVADRLLRGRAQRLIVKLGIQLFQERFRKGKTGAVRRKDGARIRRAQRAYAALRLTLLSAMAVSFLSVAFSSSRFCCSTLAQSSRPSCLAKATSVP